MQCTEESNVLAAIGATAAAAIEVSVKMGAPAFKEEMPISQDKGLNFNNGCIEKSPEV